MFQQKRNILFPAKAPPTSPSPPEHAPIDALKGAPNGILPQEGMLGGLATQLEMRSSGFTNDTRAPRKIPEPDSTKSSNPPPSGCSLHGAGQHHQALTSSDAPAQRLRVAAQRRYALLVSSIVGLSGCGVKGDVEPSNVVWIVSSDAAINSCARGPSPMLGGSSAFSTLLQRMSDDVKKHLEVQFAPECAEGKELCHFRVVEWPDTAHHRFHRSFMKPTEENITQLAVQEVAAALFSDASKKAPNGSHRKFVALVTGTLGLSQIQHTVAAVKARDPTCRIGIVLGYPWKSDVKQSATAKGGAASDPQKPADSSRRRKRDDDTVTLENVVVDFVVLLPLL